MTQSSVVGKSIKEWVLIYTYNRLPAYADLQKSVFFINKKPVILAVYSQIKSLISTILLWYSQNALLFGC